MFFYYFKRILKSRIYLICICIFVMVLICGCLEQLWMAHVLEENSTCVMECLWTTMDGGGICCVIVPALIPAAFLFFYTEELEKKAVYYQLIRSSRRNYYCGQIFSALVSVLLMAVISMIVFIIICLAMGVTWENTGWFVIYEETNVAEYFMGDGSWKITLWYFVLSILYCLVWPLFGILVSLFTKNRYVILAAPFVIFMAWNYISQLIYGIFHNILWVMPIQPVLLWGLPWEAYWSIELHVIYPIIYHVVLLGGLSLACLLIIKRRFVKEGI